MAAYAELLGVPARLIATESRASTTWENVEFSVPLLENFDRLAFVSDPLHAARARRYLQTTAPGARRTPRQRRRLPPPGALVAQGAGRGLRAAGALPLPALIAPPARRLCGPASLSVPSFLAPYLALCTTISADYGHEESAGACKKAGVHRINQGSTAERATARAVRRAADEGTPTRRDVASDAQPRPRPRPPPPKPPGRDRRAR